jgi:hypothetical protein
VSMMLVAPARIAEWCWRERGSEAQRLLLLQMSYAAIWFVGLSRCCLGREVWSWSGSSIVTSWTKISRSLSSSRRSSLNVGLHKENTDLDWFTTTTKHDLNNRLNNWFLPGEEIHNHRDQMLSPNKVPSFTLRWSYICIISTEQVLTFA